MGPFDVEADQIERLGTRFAPFVNRLLEAETATHRLDASTLSVTRNETTADGGVDAALRGSTRTDWLPAGDSAWQFKRSAPGPQACADELAGATWAHEFIRHGGSYVIVLGHSLTDNLVENRRLAVAEKVVELGLIAADDRERIRVYDANALARWASQFPALSVAGLLQGPGTAAVDYDRWSQSREHQRTWVPDAARAAAIAAIRTELATPTLTDLRIQGDSGYGKTRLVLEALRDASLSGLVAYVHDERAVDGELIAHFSQERRTAIFVVDDCPPERHWKLAERLPAQPSIRLVTIGGRGFAATRSPVIDLDRLPPDETVAFLRQNFPRLGDEARRFIVDHTDGNTRWTILFAERLTGADAVQAADLIRRNDIETFVTTFLPEGRPFYLASLLALAERVGWYRELRPQLEILAVFAGVEVMELEAAAQGLAARGLLTQEGRYRAITPHPLAVYLAAEAWRVHGDRIVDQLLPALDDDLAHSVFRRVADLGRFEPARAVLPSLLSPAGPFGSLEALEQGRSSQLLIQLAIVLPDEVALHLRNLLDMASIEDLRAYTTSRRDLVWALEKLVWHRRTFESAADSLLRLALAENETWANNATGTWVDLFGTMLPGTAAQPQARIAYLRRVSASADRDGRLLATKAAARALAGQHETITVSGELQGGVLVEPRGRPETWDEAAQYRRGALELAANLANDGDDRVARAGIELVVNAIHPLIDDPWIADDLVAGILRLPTRALVQVRREIEHLLSLHERHGGDNRERMLACLHALAEALPPTAREQLEVLLNLRRWDLRDDDLQQRLRRHLAVLSTEDREWLLHDFAARTELAAAWELGVALGEQGVSSEIEQTLVRLFHVNPAALLGYLSALVDGGAEDAFDRFLGHPLTENLSPRDRLVIAARGPVTDQARERVPALLRDVPVAQAAIALFGWRRNLSSEEAAALVVDWLDKLETQQDYNALVDWLNLRERDEELSEHEASVLLDVLTKRAAFPDLGQQRWNWSQLASRIVGTHPLDLTDLILELMANNHLMALQHDSESEVLMSAARSNPAAIWTALADHLAEGDWRVQMEIRGWLLHAIPVDVLDAWIGQDIDRARIVASVAPVGAGEPTPIAHLLLERFGDDYEVQQGLWSDFVSGSWTGPESARLDIQIAQLEGWLRDPIPGVRNWAGGMLVYLRRRRDRALEEEAERGF